MSNSQCISQWAFVAISLICADALHLRNGVSRMYGDAGELPDMVWTEQIYLHAPRQTAGVELDPAVATAISPHQGQEEGETLNLNVHHQAAGLEGTSGSIAQVGENSGDDAASGPPLSQEEHDSQGPRFFAFHNKVPGTDPIFHFWDNDMQAHTFHAGHGQGVEIELNTEFYAFADPSPGTVPIYQVSPDGSEQQVQFYAFPTADGAQDYAKKQGFSAGPTVNLTSSELRSAVGISPLDAKTDEEVMEAWDETVRNDRRDLQPPQLQNQSDRDWYSDYFAYRENNALENLSYTANQTQPTKEQIKAEQKREDDAWAALEPNVTAEEEEAQTYYHTNFTNDEGNALENFTYSSDYYEVDEPKVQLGNAAAEANASSESIPLNSSQLAGMSNQVWKTKLIAEEPAGELGSKLVAL